MSTPVAVLGTGQMGCGIAQAAAQAGHPVLFWNRREESVEGGLGRIRKAMDRLRSKEKISAEVHAETLERIRGITVLEEVKEAHWVIESVPERNEIKRPLWEKLGGICSQSAVLATNTSSLSITALASFSGHSDRFLGLHFFNPVPLMSLVEVVSGERTAPEVADLATRFATGLGKVPIRVNDRPGFVVNRVLMPMINEAANALMEGVATAQAIDECMKLGCNHPLGPLALADLVGLDVVHAILDQLHSEFGAPHYKPCPLITKKVEAGLLGTKTGQGFYAY